MMNRWHHLPYSMNQKVMTLANVLIVKKEIDIFSSSSAYEVAKKKYSSQCFEEVGRLWSELEMSIIFVILRGTFPLAALFMATDYRDGYTYTYK